MMPAWPGQEIVMLVALGMRKDAMSRGYSSVERGYGLNTTPVIIGAVLISVGALLGVCGAFISGREVFSATRRWLGDLEVPPGEVARHKWDQTRAAATAGVAAWHQHDGAVTRGARR
jgi:hypothetical protein